MVVIQRYQFKRARCGHAPGQEGDVLKLWQSYLFIKQTLLQPIMGGIVAEAFYIKLSWCGCIEEQVEILNPCDVQIGAMIDQYSGEKAMQ